MEKFIYSRTGFEGTLLCSQELASGLHPPPAETNKHPSTQFIFITRINHYVTNTNDPAAWCSDNAVHSQSVSLSRGTSQSEVPDLPQSLRPNAGMVARLRHHRFLPNLFQFINHLTIPRYMQIL
jgi:hypothetical protein